MTASSVDDIPLSTIAVRRRVRPGKKAKRFRITERKFFDFVIDGQSLLDAIGGGYVSCFVRGFDRLNDEARTSLLKFDDGQRVALYVCPECGDIGCGAIFTRSHKRDGFVIWDRLFWENDRLDGVDYGMRTSMAERGLGPFRFEFSAYEAAMAATRAF